MEKHLYDCGVTRVPPETRAAVEVAPCPVCRHNRAVPTFQVEGITSVVAVCERCGLGSLHPMPGEEEIAGFYPAEYYGETGTKFEPMVERMVRVVAARHARFLMRGLKSHAKILDVGCGRGVLLRAFADMGYEAHGVEVSEDAAEGVDPRAEVRIAGHLAAAGYEAGYFDRIVIWHVLEHLTDPRETLIEMHRILRPGGRVIVAVPNFSSLQARWAGPAWFHLDLPRHLYHFPSQALRQLIEDCGFECREVHHFSLRQNPFGWVQSALNRSSSMPRNALYTMLQRGNDPANKALPGSTRLKMRLAYYLGMPLALGLSVLTAAMRSGATVHIVGKKPG